MTKRLLLILCFFPGWVFAQPDQNRQAELRNLLKHDCGACHGLTLKGGLGPALRPDDLKSKHDELLITTILEGRKGTAMPPWKPFISQDEAAWLLTILRKGD